MKTTKKTNKDNPKKEDKKKKLRQENPKNEDEQER